MNKNKNSRKIAAYLRKEIDNKEEILVNTIDSCCNIENQYNLKKDSVAVVYLVYKDIDTAQNSELYKKAINGQFKLHQSLVNTKSEIDYLLSHVTNLKSALTWYEDKDEFDD